MGDTGIKMHKGKVVRKYEEEQELKPAHTFTLNSQSLELTVTGAFLLFKASSLW